MLININKLPIQAFAQKIARSRGMSVLSTHIDHIKKTFTYNVCVGNDKVEDKIVTFDEAAKVVGWKGMTADSMYAYSVLETPYVKPVNPDTLDKDDPDHIIQIDKHFAEKDYQWMSNNRITTPMNVDTTDLAKINEVMMHGAQWASNGHCHDVGSFFDGIKLAEKFDNEDVENVDFGSDAYDASDNGESFDDNYGMD